MPAATAPPINRIQNNPVVPPEVSAQASTQLASGVPFVSEADLTVALESAAVPDELATEIVQEYNDASLAALRASMAAVALIALVAPSVGAHSDKSGGIGVSDKDGLPWQGA